VQYLDTASVVLGALAGMADTPAAPLPRGSYFTEARIETVWKVAGGFLIACVSCLKSARWDFSLFWLVATLRIETYSDFPDSLWKGVSANFGCFDSWKLEYRDVRSLRVGGAAWEYPGTWKGTAHTLGGSR
jgi:hypothetical protein